MGKGLDYFRYKNILITGGAGFVGSNLALRLIEKGCNVTVLDNLSPQIHGENPERDSPLYQSIFGRVTFVHGDVTNRSDWEKVIEDKEVIIHFAAETGTGQSMYLIEKYNRVNALGTAIMMDVLLNHPNTVQKVILASSRAVYGEGKYLDSRGNSVYPPQRDTATMQQKIFEVLGEDGRVLLPAATDELSEIRPASVYGLTKSYQEDILRAVAIPQGIKYVILRYQNVYGAGQSLLNPYTGILSVFTSQIRSGNPINVFEDGKPQRDFVYVDDAVDATMLAMNSENADNQELNVGTGVGTTILDVAETLVKVYNKPTQIRISGSFRIGDIRHNVADLSKIKKLLNFQPQVTFQHGVQRFAEWASQQNISENNFGRSLREMREKGLLK